MKPTRALAWWRIKLDRSGKVLECKRVARALKNGVRTIYVEARDQKAAGRLAFNAYCAWRNQVRRARYAREGKCKCGRPWNPKAAGNGGYKTCTFCRSTVEQYRERSAARKAGADIPRPDMAETYRKRREQEAADLRLEVLREVRAAWVRAKDYDAFVRWLCNEITKAGGAERGKAVA